MKKIKVSVFFTMENEEERSAYEIFMSLGRKKSAIVTFLLNRYAEECRYLAKQERETIRNMERLVKREDKSRGGFVESLISPRNKDFCDTGYRKDRMGEVGGNDIGMQTGSGLSDNGSIENNLIKHDRTLILKGLQVFQ